MNAPGSWFAVALEFTFLLFVLAAAIFVALETRTLFASRRAGRRHLDGQARDEAIDPGHLPPVTVLLPVRNEPAVVERLLDAACRLRYPAGSLEILLLDDSSDATTALAERKIAEQAASGVDIRRVSRDRPERFKAGNLMHGVTQARGEYFAVFDADFMPPADFLLRAMPHFADPRLGVVQTGIGWYNVDHSFLTRFQAMEMSHYQYLTMGLHATGRMAQLTGSSVVWRKACIESLGGWSAETATEDTDLSYRAQFNDWTYRFLPDVVSMSAVPDTPSAFRLQRERWGRGLIHNSWRHLSLMIRQPMPAMRRLQALAMMFSSTLLALVFVVFLLSVPAAFLIRITGGLFVCTALAYGLIVVIWALNNAFSARAYMRVEDRTGALRTCLHAYLYLAMYLPMAWYYFVGCIRALCGSHAEFNRTPKGAEAPRERMPPINWLMMLGEAGAFVYAVAGIACGFSCGHVALIPLHVTAAVGFGMMLWWSWQEHRGRAHG